MTQRDLNATMETVISILRKHGAKRIEIFGSYARGEQKKTSDLDIIVKFEDKKTLIELIGIEQELEDALGMEVDLLTEASISPYMMNRIKKEAVSIFPAHKIKNQIEHQQHD